MTFEEWKRKWVGENRPIETCGFDIDALLDRALTAGYQRKVAEKEADTRDVNQAMIEDLVENVDEFKSAWAVTFIESIEGKEWEELSPKQKAKVEELYEEI
jgi:hypothetical protein